MANRKLTQAVFNRSITHKRLFDHMYAIGGHRLNEFDGPNRSYIELWQLGSVVVLIQFYAEGGWGEYVGSRTNSVDETLDRLTRAANGLI